eukprot:403362233
MRLIDKSIVYKNVNHHFGISSETQDQIRIGSTQYILDVGKFLDLNSQVIQTAIIYNQLFFLKKSYLNYEKELYQNAALYLASKNLNHKRKISDFCLYYHKLKYLGSLYKPPQENQIKQLSEDICIAECKLLQHIDYLMEVDLPGMFIEKFTRLLYEKQDYNTDGNQHSSSIVVSWQNINRIAIAAANDTFYTPVNVLFSPQSIAVACVIFAAMKFGMPIPFNNKEFNFETCFERYVIKRGLAGSQSQVLTQSQGQNDEKRQAKIEEYRRQFNELSWEKKIDLSCDLEEVVESIKYIEQFYSNLKNNME